MQVVFILGSHPKISIAEIKSVVAGNVVYSSDAFLIMETEKIDCVSLQNRLGGTIKVGKVLTDKIDKKIIVETLRHPPERLAKVFESFSRAEVQSDKKLNFGLSYYNCSQDKLGMEVKKELRQMGINSRLVVSKDKALSSVVVWKNKVEEFLVLGLVSPLSVPISPGLSASLKTTLSLSKGGGRGVRGEGARRLWLAKTCAVQNFEAYSLRDYGRPVRDMRSGSLPPKLAQIMINLAQAPAGGKILDPFCGSGTIIQEGVLMGYEMIGSDVSEKSVKDTKSNLEWLAMSFPRKRESTFGKGVDPRFHGDDRRVLIFQSDVRQISGKVKSVDAIITEPYLGPPLQGSESRNQILKNIQELNKLYLAAFDEFVKVLKKSGKVVIVFPSFMVGREAMGLDIATDIKKLGFHQSNTEPLLYGRLGQKVYRDIKIFEFSF